jgi:hypothetical protein
MDEETYTQVMPVIVQVLEVIAAGVLFTGLLWSLWISLRDYRRRRDGVPPWRKGLVSDTSVMAWAAAATKPARE